MPSAAVEVRESQCILLVANADFINPLVELQHASPTPCEVSGQPHPARVSGISFRPVAATRVRR